jgi:amino-acid N-acetyltransferase
MKIRKATEADFPAIQAIIRQFPEQLMQEHLPDPDEFFVAEEDSLIGCCALEVYSQRLAEVRSLAVLEEHRGRGIASQLVAACMQEATDRGIYEVLAITGTPALFEKQGFGAFKSEKYALLKILG